VSMRQSQIVNMMFCDMIVGDEYHLAIKVRGFSCSTLPLRLVDVVVLTGGGEGEWDRLNSCCYKYTYFSRIVLIQVVQELKL